MRRKLCVIALTTAAVLAGCSTDVPDLSHVDNNIAAQYVADALLRHDKHYDELLDYDHSILKATPTPVPTEAPTPMPSQDPGSSKPGAGGQNNQAGQTVSNASMSEIYGIPDVTIEPTSYEVKNSYGSTQYSVVTAGKGKKLAIVHFRISNKSGKDKRVTLAGKEVSAQLYINGTSVGSSKASFANGDLHTFDEKIGAGKKKQGVLLFEIANSTKISSVEVRFAKGNKQASMAVH